jgi:hypothetical protein
MPKRWIGLFAAATAASTALWVVLMVVSMANMPPVETIEQMVVAIEAQGPLYAVLYGDSALLTLFAVLFMTALYDNCREMDPFWATIGFVFVPMYGIANLFAYLSQVFLVPTLLSLAHEPASQQTAMTLLALTIHTWPGSAIEGINALAYALLGVPSVIFALIGLRQSRLARVGGGLLALSGIMSMLALLGVLLSVAALAGLSGPAGGVFFVSAAVLAGHFLRSDAASVL